MSKVASTGEVVKTAVPIRFDPFDLSTAYAPVQGQWVTCRSSYVGLSGHTARELFLATQELRKCAKRDGVRAELSAARLADLFFFLITRHPPIPPLFPYTALFQ